MAETDSERATVWLFITALCVGGAEQTLVELANGLDDDDYDVTVWTIFDANPIASELRSGVPVRSLTSAGTTEHGTVTGVTNPMVYIIAPIKFCCAAAIERPDIIHSFLFCDNMLARGAGLVSPATVITGVRSVPKEPNRLRALLDRATISMSDVIISNSNAGKKLAIDRGASPQQVTVIRNGRDLSTYQNADETAVEAEIHCDKELVVGTVGRLIERKGHFELLTAWSRIHDTDIKARLVFVGDGPDREAIEKHARNVGCIDSVEFLGMRQDVPALLSMMDVFVFPSHFEGLPGAVIEAMAAGLAIAATPVDGTGEILDNYRTGLFVPVDAPEELAWAMRRLLETPALRDSLGNAAQREAETAFDIETMVEEFGTVYEQLQSS